MSWLTEYVRPRIRTLLGRREVPDNLWTQCPACEQMVFTRELEANLKVCPHCGHHMRPSAQERLLWTFDPGAAGEATHTRIELPRAPADPLGFRDQKRYADRLREARTRTGLDDALLVAHGTIGGRRAVVAAMAFEFMAGSMGAAVGEGIVAAARLAVLQSAPLVVFTASGGARMQEGAISLMQLPRTVIAVRMLKDAGLPFLVVLTDPTTGGVSASFAMLGDVQLAEPGALIGFAGARVIEQTVRETLPDGFQRAEYLHQHGIVDMVVHRAHMRETLARLIGLLRREPAAAAAGVPALAAERPGETADAGERPGEAADAGERLEIATAESAPGGAEPDRASRGPDAGSGVVAPVALAGAAHARALRATDGSKARSGADGAGTPQPVTVRSGTRKSGTGGPEAGATRTDAGPAVTAASAPAAAARQPAAQRGAATSPAPDASGSPPPSAPVRPA